MEDETFYITCEVCETECELIVHDVDEIPAFCPMCAAPIEVD
jgi:hypothetical protein